MTGMTLSSMAQVGVKGTNNKKHREEDENDDDDGGGGGGGGGGTATKTAHSFCFDSKSTKEEKK